MAEFACDQSGKSGKMKRAERVRQHPPGSEHSDALWEHRAMSDGSKYGKRRRACKTEQSENCFSGKWGDQQAFTATLYADGWGTPNTYCNQFRPLISGPAVYLLLLVKTETYREAMVAYVGMSERLKQRIASHNILPELERPGYWPMVWFKPTPKKLLRETEASLIASYDPPWNIMGRPRGVPLQ